MNDQTTLQSPHPKVTWRDKVPYSEQFQDIYFSADNGMHESEYVYIRHNQLHQRWHDMLRYQKQRFTIAELGFGCGLNFLMTWQHWQDFKTPQSRLHYIAIEKHPLSKTQIAKSLLPFTRLSTLADTLLLEYPSCLPGHHLIKFHRERLQLTLIIADINDAMHNLLHAPAGIDAWFFDGFAPEKNPQMWALSVFRNAYLLSNNGASFSTYSAASTVQKHLEQAGFWVHKDKGFNNKREMLYGAVNKSSAPSLTKRSPSNQAVIIGAGYVGCMTATALAERGYRVTIVEQLSGLAQSASGMKQAVVYARLYPNRRLDARLEINYLQYAKSFYRQLFHRGQLTVKQDGDCCGVLQLSFNEQQTEYQHKIKHFYQQYPDLVRIIDAKQASLASGIYLPYGGLLFDDIGWIHPQSVCQKIIEHSRHIEVITDQHIKQLIKRAQHWHLINKENHVILRTPIIVLANGYRVNDFLMRSKIPLRLVGGSISYLPANNMTRMLRTVICHEGHITPTTDNINSIGSSYEKIGTPLMDNPIRHQHNIDKIRTHLPQLLEGYALPHDGFSNIRCVSPDRQPVIGEFLPGLYLNTAYGSRAICRAPLGAEVLASLINREMPIIEHDLIQSLAPHRFQS